LASHRIASHHAAIYIFPSLCTMIKTAAIVIALVTGSTSAFAPTGLNRINTRLQADVAVEEAAPVEEVEVVEAVPEAPVSKVMVPGVFCNGYVGGEGPEPIPFTLSTTSSNWDPAGFAERAPEWVPWFREAELKHGRAAMLATVGFVVPEFMRIPGDQFTFENVPYVINAHDQLPDSMSQIFLWISLLEACTIPALANMNNWDRMPGDFSFDPLGIYPQTEEKQREMQLMELKNGRLAMIAIGGLVAGAAVTGSHFPYLQ